MGGISLGCLLGQYDRAQSFDVNSSGTPSDVRSWTKSGQSSWFFVGSAAPQFVHSSAQSLRIDVFSNAGSASVLSYTYGRADDAYTRWFPEIDTHALEAAAWLLVHPATSSGGFRFELFAHPGASRVLPGRTLGADPLEFIRLASLVHSDGGGAPRVAVQIPAGAGISSNASILADDVLTTVDPVPLYPEWSFEDRSELIRAQHRTRSGVLHDLVWQKFLSYSMPLRYLPGSHAALLNWWWEQGLALLLTLDSSDGESLHAVRIVNDSQPIGKRLRPYADLWEGTLHLESLDPGGLAY
jgi:hypothetical protein